MQSGWLFPILILLQCSTVSVAQTTAQDISPVKSSITDTETVTYPARFFIQYRPLTALDMLQRLPGFEINDGDDLRGFGSAAGNVLINYRRPSTKQDLISAILGRIPAANVERIELIRGQVSDINLEGHSIVANVIMKTNASATNRWETFLIHTKPSPLGVGGSFSFAHQWRAIDYNLGIDIERDTNGITGTVERYDAANTLVETRIDDRHQTGIAISGIYLNASTLLDGTMYNLNTKFGYREGDGMEFSRRFPQISGKDPFEILFEDEGRRPQVSVGLDAERFLRKDLQGKAILVFAHANQDATSSQNTVYSSNANLDLKIASEENRTTEAIARLEFDWFGWAEHTLMGNIEGAYNVLDNSLMLTEDTGAGPIIVNVPNANSRVEEVRGNILLKDTFTRGDWVWSFGLGAEISTITQTGDAEQQRSFSYLKPESLITYSPTQYRQSRLRIAREVSQLNFSDFVSTTVFVDDDLALGNPDLKPETTWVAELTHERRMGQLGVVNLTLFHHWITDVMDLLPFSDNFEVPGNIGDGRRWGLEAAATMPLDWLNLTDARLDLQLRWQDSNVTDPVTGNTRKLSADGGFSGPPTIRFRSENDYVIDIAFRQDLHESGWAWGWDMANQADRILFKVNELERFEEGVELNAFIETTRWRGIKVRLEGNNLLNYLEVRDRLGYIGRRDQSPIQQRELRLRKPHRVFTLTFSGTF